jgi:hypothetical protein
LLAAAAAIILPTATERLFEAAGYVSRHLLQALRIYTALLRGAHQPFASCGSRLAQPFTSIGRRFRQSFSGGAERFAFHSGGWESSCKSRAGRRPGDGNCQWLLANDPLDRALRLLRNPSRLMHDRLTCVIGIFARS